MFRGKFYRSKIMSILRQENLLHVHVKGYLSEPSHIAQLSSVLDILRLLKQHDLLSVTNIEDVFKHINMADRFSKHLTQLDVINQANFDDTIKILEKINDKKTDFSFAQDIKSPKFSDKFIK